MRLHKICTSPYLACIFPIHIRITFWFTFISCRLTFCILFPIRKTLGINRVLFPILLSIKIASFQSNCFISYASIYVYSINSCLSLECTIFYYIVNFAQPFFLCRAIYFDSYLLSVLVYKDWITVWIFNDKATWSFRC